MQLTTQERSQLRSLEKTIENGIKTFIEVGNALKAIRDAKLYVEQHKTFEKYVTERWGMQKSHAYRLIESAEVVTNLSPIGDKFSLPTSESQTRELAPLPPEKQAEVWERVVMANPEPTAKDVRAEVVKEIESVAIEVPEQAKPEPSKKEQAAKLRSAILQHNAAMMRLVDDLNNVYRDKEKHGKVHEAFRDIHAIVEAWK
jgi:hypothetical protein